MRPAARSKAFSRRFAGEALGGDRALVVLAVDLGSRSDVTSVAASCAPAVRVALSAGHVELHTNPDDRRILQVRLTAAGRSELRARRAREAGWVIEHFNGLGLHEITATAHILNVLRRRLVRAERERRERR